MDKNKFLTLVQEVYDKIDKDFKRIIKSNGSIGELLAEVEKSLDYCGKKSIELNRLYGQHEKILHEKIDIGKITRGIGLQKKSLSLLYSQLQKIKNSSCSNCKKKITPDNCWVYLWNESKIKKWTLDKVNQFSHEDFERHVPLFCGESCFKQSHWSSKPNEPNKDRNNENEPKKAKENYICWECHKTNSEKWFINPETGLEFCSQACNLEHNTELCEDCVQKCLKYNEKGIAVDYQTYYRDSKEKIGILCFTCKQKQKKELEEELKRLEKEQGVDKEELERIKTLIESSNDDKNQESRIKNQESRIKNQIANLEAIPNLTPEQEQELARKKAELAILEQKLKDLERNQKEREQQPDKSKDLGLRIGIGIGVVVVLGVMGVFVIRSMRNKNK